MSCFSCHYTWQGGSVRTQCCLEGKLAGTLHGLGFCLLIHSHCRCSSRARMLVRTNSCYIAGGRDAKVLIQLGTERHHFKSKVWWLESESGIWNTHTWYYIIWTVNIDNWNSKSDITVTSGTWNHAWWEMILKQCFGGRNSCDVFLNVLIKSEIWRLESEIWSLETEISAMKPATCDHLGAALAADLSRSSKFSLSKEAALAALDQKLEISIIWGLHCWPTWHRPWIFDCAGAALAAVLVRSSKFPSDTGLQWQSNWLGVCSFHIPRRLL